MNQKQDYEVMVYEAVRWVAFLSVRAGSPEEAETAVKRAYERESTGRQFDWQECTRGFERIEVEPCEESEYCAEHEVVDGELVSECDEVDDEEGEHE